ncbi:hypothetical protein MMC11_003352 [Xylographa trunciseda]|nr:hypothetical protein [Xylographa trunciseda]
MTSHYNDVAELSILELAAIHLTGHSGLERREWNALIGIVTAIVGNILISFALNIQRYAHIRLNREKDEKQATWGNGKGKTSHGSEQARIAEERAELNLSAPMLDEDDTVHQQRYHGGGTTGEPGLTPQSLRSRSSSQSTIKQEKAREEPAQSTTYLKSPYWWAGILLMTIGEAGNFLAYGFAPASIVSPLGVVALVSNCIIAPYLLKERFRRRDLFGVIVAVAGAVTVVLSAKNSETKMGPQDLWTAITRWEFEVYLGITAGLIIILMWASGKYGGKSILIDLGLVGLFGGYTALSTKGVASLLSDTLWRSLTFPITYLLTFILVATALLQIHYVNRALQRFDSTQVIPTQFVLFTISVIVGSSILYRDFESATLDRVVKFVAGCALTFLGVYLITSGRSEDTNNEDEDSEDEEQMIGLIDEEEQHENAVRSDDEGDNIRRKSQMSITFDDGTSTSTHGRLSRQQSNAHHMDPQTPRRFNSGTSSSYGQPITPPEANPDSPLLRNPWSSPQEYLSGRQPLLSTISAPIVPGTASEHRPSASRGHSNQLEPPRADRPLTMTRNSISRMFPGPLISPLSSSLSAVVADNLRRGLDSPTRPRRRRGLSGVRTSRSHRLLGGMASDETPLMSTDGKGGQHMSEPPSEGAPRPKGRSQSVSFGDLFRFTTGRSKGDSQSSEIEEGSSESGELGKAGPGR